MLRSLTLCSLLVSVLSIALPIQFNGGGSHGDILGGALCQPCIQLIKNGEQNTEGSFDAWFDKEVNAVCSPLGSLKKLCVSYFKQYENDFNGFITNKADPKKSCESIDFCS